MRLLQPLRTRSILLLWSGMSLSAIGDQLYAVALSWIAVSVFGSAGGYLTALQAVVVLLAALGLGRWADRWDPQRSMIGADLLRAATLLLVVGAWMAHGGPAAGFLVLAVVVLAAGQAVFQPALQTVLPRLADVALLPATNGLIDATDRSARLLGPGLIALLASVVPPVHFLTLDAVSFLLSAAALVVIRRRQNLAIPRRAAVEGVWSGITRGTRAMSAHPILGFVLRTTALVNGAWYAAFFLALPLLIGQLGVRGPGGSGLGAYGTVISAYGCTNLAGTLLLGGRALPARPQFLMFSGSLLVGLGMALMGVAALLPPSFILPGLAAAAALGAAGGPMKDIPLAVLRQTRLPAADMAAGMRAYMAANAAGMLVALLIAPSLLRAFGTIPVIVACGVLLAGVGAAGLLRLARWTETAAA
ncbi:MAG: MFS transporter [Acetobacteraceae bacterium]|nr:MFS transporter [Acetobacteraceae bacterium]